MNPLVEGHTNTTIFLLPILFPHITYDKLFSNYFEEAYVGMIDNDDYDDTIIFKFKEEEDVYVETLTSCKLLELKNNIVIYNIPEEFKEEYENFLKGKYSKLIEESKQDILSFWGEDENSPLYGILYKTEKGKDFFTNIIDKKHKAQILKSLDFSELEFWPPPNILSNELLIGDAF